MLEFLFFITIFLKPKITPLPLECFYRCFVRYWSEEKTHIFCRKLFRFAPRFPPPLIAERKCIEDERTATPPNRLGRWARKWAKFSLGSGVRGWPGHGWCDAALSLGPAKKRKMSEMVFLSFNFIYASISLAPSLLPRSGNGIGGFEVTRAQWFFFALRDMLLDVA